LSVVPPGRSGATAALTLLAARLTKPVPDFLAAAVFRLADFTTARALRLTDLMLAPCFLATFLRAAFLAMALRFTGRFALLAMICSFVWALKIP
jgi:hypothetical protein